MAATVKQATRAKLVRRVRDADATRRRVLHAAKAEFARLGFAGARVAAIAARAHANKQLIYHYFGSKENLYVAVLDALMPTSASRRACWMWSNWNLLKP